MNPKNPAQNLISESTFEPCDNVQTENKPHTKTIEPCDTVQTKTGRGGARKNSGMKPTGIETVTVRIDKRLLNLVTTIKAEFKDGKSLNDIIGKNNDAELLRKNTALNNVNKILCRELESEKKKRVDEVNRLNQQIDSLNLQLLAARTMGSAYSDFRNNSGIDADLLKRLRHLCHPDKHGGSSLSHNVFLQLGEL